MNWCSTSQRQPKKTLFNYFEYIRTSSPLLQIIWPHVVTWTLLILCLRSWLTSWKFPADAEFPCDRVFCLILQIRVTDCKYGKYGYRFIYDPKWSLSFIAAFYIKIYFSKFSCMKIYVNTFLRSLLVSKTQSVIDEKTDGHTESSTSIWLFLVMRRATILSNTSQTCAYVRKLAGCSVLSCFIVLSMRSCGRKSCCWGL